MTDTKPDPAPQPRRWRVTLSRPALLFGEMLSPSHPHIEVDDAGLVALGDAVATKAELQPQPGQG